MDGWKLMGSRIVCIVGAVLLLGACSTRDGGTAGGLFGVGGAKKPMPAEFLKTTPVYCPPVTIRASTESMTLYERGHEGEADHVRFLYSINKTERECRQDGTTLSIRLGIAGRVVAGPKGGAATLKLPVRVVIMRQMGGTGPVYSQLFQVPVAVGPPNFGANFAHVIDQVTLTVGPDDRNLILYVGFDEGPKRTS